MTAIHAMPALLLKKPSKTSKVKNLLKVLERRLRLWYEENITKQGNKSKTIRKRLSSTSSQMNKKKLSCKFWQVMQKGKVNGATLLLTK